MYHYVICISQIVHDTKSIQSEHTITAWMSKYEHVLYVGGWDIHLSQCWRVYHR